MTSPDCVNTSSCEKWTDLEMWTSSFSYSLSSWKTMVNTFAIFYFIFSYLIAVLFVWWSHWKKEGYQKLLGKLHFFLTQGKVDFKGSKLFQNWVLQRPESVFFKNIVITFPPSPMIRVSWWSFLLLNPGFIQVFVTTFILKVWSLQNLTNL